MPLVKHVVFDIVALLLQALPVIIVLFVIFSL